MSYYFRYLFLILAFIIAVISSACNNKKPRRHKGHNRQIVQENTTAKVNSDSLKCSDLFKLIHDEKYDEFYRAVSPVNLKYARSCFEDYARSGVSFNYGVLLNANIVTNFNRALLKPKLSEIASFSFVPNDGKCFMNAPLYAMARSGFFDNFLEIDKLFSRKWQARKPTNLAVANEILHSLREVIYEIRRGKNTNATRIATLRDSHYDSFASLKSKELLYHVYYELFSSYNFDNVISAFQDQNGTIKAKLINFNSPLPRVALDTNNLAGLLEDFRILGEVPYGPINALVSLGGNQDLVYIDSLFSILDPWGAIARFLSFALSNTRSVNDIYRPSYQDGLQFFLNLGGEPRSIFVFYDNPTVEGYGLHLRHLRDPIANIPQGKVVYKYEKGRAEGLSRAEQGYKLIAKTKHSHDHQIAELFNATQDKWETHHFFGPPLYSKDLSAPLGFFEDQLSFYELGVD